MAWPKRRAPVAQSEPEIGCFGMLAVLVGGALLGVGLIGLLILLAKIVY